jgi:tetratricopeptide (TPR) repeat protein
MSEQINFRFAIPRPPEGPLVELSSAEAEKILLKRLDEAKTDPTQALWDLAQFYKLSKQHEKAVERLRQLLERLPDPEDKANCVLTMGQAMEQVGDYPAAVRYYKEALALEPTHTFTWYFINNNLGFSLNSLRQFAEGEIYCRRAIEIDPNRPNAYKNLGIALAGQGQYQAAARCFVTATQANAADGRAFRLLEDLMKQHPELEFEFQEIIESCGKAVEAVAKKAAELRPVVHRGWRKHLILFRARLRSILSRIFSSNRPPDK